MVWGVNIFILHRRVRFSRLFFPNQVMGGGGQRPCFCFIPVSGKNKQTEFGELCVCGGFFFFLFFFFFLCVCVCVHAMTAPRLKALQVTYFTLFLYDLGEMPPRVMAKLIDHDI